MFFPPLEWRAVLAFVGAGITIMLGSIPQQDVFQRVMSAKDERTAAIGPVIGGVLYMVFALVPMFIALASLIIIPDESHQLLSGEHGDLLVPTLVLVAVALAPGETPKAKRPG